MNDGSELKNLAVLVSDGNPENLFYKFVNLVKQTAFKEKHLKIFIFIRDISEKSLIEKYLPLLPDKSVELFDVKEFKNVLSKSINTDSIGLVTIYFGQISLRPDAIDLLSSFLQNNNFIDGAFADTILSIDNQNYFEVVESNFASNFPFEFKQIPKNSKLLPELFVLKKEIFYKFFEDYDTISSFNALTFANFLWENEFQIEKLDSILSSKPIDLSDGLTNEKIETPIKEKWLLERLSQKFGSNSIRTLFYNELNNLPYHFSNPFNDLVSVVVFDESRTNSFEKEVTLNSLKFQSHRNIEIIECIVDVDSISSACNFVSLIANGKYLFFLNAGDEVFSNTFVVLIELLKEREQIGYVYFDYIQEQEQRVVRNLDFSFEKLKKFNFIPHYLFFNRSIFLKGNHFDESLPFAYSFWDLLLTLGEKGIFGTRYSEPLLKVKRIGSNFDTKNALLDANYKAKIVLNHKDLFTPMQFNWAKSTLEGENMYDNSKIPIGIIPSNSLLTKVIVNKYKEEKVDTRKKILFVMYGWNETGGGTIFPKNVAIELAKRGWDVSVFYASLKYDPAMPLYSMERSQEGGVKLYGLYNRPAAFIDPENPGRETSDPMVEQRFKEVLDEVEPEIIHIHNLHGLSLSLPKIAKEKFKVPIVYTPHNYFLIDPKLYMINSDLTLWIDTDFFANSELAKQFPEKRKDYERRQELAKQTLQDYFDLVLAVSRRQKEILKEFAGNDKNIIVVHQANKIVDKLWEDDRLRFEVQRKVPKKVRFGYIGGVFPTKGVHNIAKAAQYFLPSDIEFHIFGFVGQKYAEQLNSIDRKKMLQYHNEYSYENLISIASEIDVGIVPSIYEDPAPLVLLEMNAMRLPVLGSKIGGIPDFVVDGVNGFLFEYDDIDSLVSAIQFCSLNPDVVDSIRQQLEPVHYFVDYVSHVEKIYLDLIEKKVRNPKDYELIITTKLLRKRKVGDITFTRRVELPEEFQANFANLGYELLDLRKLEETDDYSVYQAEFMVPKSITLEKFFEEIGTEAKSETFEEVVSKEFNLFPESESPQLDEKVFELSDLEEILSPKEEIKEEVHFEMSQSKQNVGVKIDKSNFKPELNVVWEGSQFVYHSLALINREHCSNLIDTNLVEVTIVPYEADQFQPLGNPKYEKLAKMDIRIKEEPPEWIKKLPYLWVRHQWPPKAEPPKGAKWVIMQPWEFTTLPKKFVDIFIQADELWVPSNFTRQAFINSGIPFNKVQVVPNGVDPNLFQPKGAKYKLPTDKKLKFLYVGGTTYRKGFDILLQSYVSAFSSKDDVVLVVKDMGTESFYKGQTAEEMINQIKEDPNSPEIIYIKHYLTEEEMASLYRACDVFVSPYRGEGFSLPTLEAMACGLPVIVTEGGSTEDFVLDSFAWKIPSYKISIGTMIDKDPLVGEAFLLEPDGDFLSGLMKSIYMNPADIVVRGILASSYARTIWTWNRSTLKLLSRIDALYGKDLSKKAKDILVDRIDAQILLGKAESYFADGQLADAYKVYQQIENRIEELSPKYKLFYYLRIAVINILNQDFENALLYLKRVDNIEKNHIDSLYLKSKILYLENKLVEALESYTELVSRWNAERFNSVIGNSLDQILVEMADLMLIMKDVDSALQLYTNAIKLNEKKLEAYIGSAKCFIEVKDYEEAKRMLDWALKIEPENEEAKSLLDQVLVQS